MVFHTNTLHVYSSAQQKKKASAQAKKLERDIETRLQDAQRQSEAIVARFEQDSLARYLDTLDAGLESAVDHIKVLRQTFDEFQTANLALVDSLEKHASHAGKRRRDQSKEDEQMHNGHAEDIAQAFGRFEKEILGTRKMLRKMNKAHHDTTKFSQHLLACVKP
ncbi:hypothetical protein BC938DRAFT_480042 [Jimgerdemannia flammicorona]|uniref:Uncharacterized protein n=1 Tax=Jimgerdemannia flammicorona TaxID=994334 RepID=A0A433QXI4_9FUNG|nr:hypothetical protein BC938DRAFT_480042 [Jimgerdemannia flammicorona]